MRFIILAACLICPCTLMAQEIPHEVVRLRAKRLGIQTVLSRSALQQELGLSEEQIEQIQKAREEFAEYYQERNLASLDIKPGETLKGNFFDIARRQTQDERDELQAIRDAQTAEMASYLTAEQLEKAEYLVLRERMQLIGADAILDSDDLGVARFNFRHDKLEIEQKLRTATTNAERRIEELKKEFKEKVREIRKQELVNALDQLGADGAAIKTLLAEIPEEPEAEPSRPSIRPSRRRP